MPGQYWTCPESALTHVVMRIEDDGIWREYLRAARRSSVGLRMESRLCSRTSLTSLAAFALASFLSADRLSVRWELMSVRRVGRCIEKVKSS